MPIYRGPGGSGDAVNDSSSEATLVAQLATEAQESADSAASSATAAAGSATAASNSASSASTSASNAATSATNASNSASAASTSATNAANSATAAQTAETNAETAETNAETAQAAAEAAQLAAETAQTAAELAETNAETAETNAETAETNAAASASAASGSASAAATSATNASNSASAASTSATNASNSASAASTSASNAATSETNAATSASTATTQAGIATTQAGLASTSASNAATSATNASNSASAAATSATNASNSASAAATSETNAAASFDSFDDRYLGSKSSAPTLDNDGNTLLVGALYFNSVDSAMKVWNGTAWLDAYASLSGALIATNNLADLSNTTTARSNLGVAIGTNVQAWDADLDTWATKTAPSGTVVGTSDTQTLTNKTIALGNNTVSGTLAQFNTAVTDADFASIAGTETLTNKTLTSPVVTGGSINNTPIGASTANTGAFTTLGATGVATFSAGTVSAPSITTTGDTNTGIFFPAADTIAFTEGGVESMRIDASGNVIVGTTSAILSAAGRGNITVNGSSSAIYTLGIGGAERGYLYVDGSSVALSSSTTIPLVFQTNGAERMAITSAGNVGIGTSSPSFGLVVQKDNGSGYVAGFRSAAGSPMLTIQNTGGISQIQGLNSALSAVADIGLQVSGGNVGIGTSSPSARVHISSPDGTAPLTLNTSGGSDSTRALNFNVAGDNYGKILVPSGSGGAMAFWTGGANASAERMRIDSAGNVGIGTSSPSYPLHVAGNTNGLFSSAVTNSSSGASAYAFLRMANDIDANCGLLRNSSGNSAYAGANSLNMYQLGAHPIGFITNNVERMRIDSSGNLLVGTTANTFSSKTTIQFAASGAETIGLTLRGLGGTTQSFVTFVNSGGGGVGSIVQNGPATVNYATSSDYRLKENVAPMTGALYLVQQLKPVTYNWKVDGSSGQGFIAHELQAVVPDCVTGEKDAVDADGKPVHQGIDTSFLVATLTAAIQEQQALIQNLTTRLNALEGK